MNLSNFDTRNVTSMYRTFYGCSSLEKLDFRNANFSNVTDFREMFRGSGKLNELNLSNITSDKYSNSNFQNILMLVPSSATVYVKDNSCIIAGQSINANLNYVVYEA